MRQALADVTFSVTLPDRTVIQRTATTDHSGLAKTDFSIKATYPKGAYFVSVAAAINGSSGQSPAVTFTVK